MNIEQAISGFTPAILKPGEILSSGKPSVVTTVLGSCVSVTMHHTASVFGAICHCMLPKCAERKKCVKEPECREWPKYVECTIRHMIKKLDELNILRSEVVVKLFGGAEMLDRTGPNNGHTKTVGAENVRVAKKILAKEGPGIAVADTGGIIGRKIFFLTHTGEIYLKRLGNE